MSRPPVALLPARNRGYGPEATTSEPTGSIHDQVEALCINMSAYLGVRNASPPTWRTWYKPNADNQGLRADGVQPDGTVIVTLSPEDHLRGTIYGNARAYANRNSANSRGYSGGRNQAERIAQPNGVLCELAVARHLNLDFDVRKALWARSAHDRNRDGADLAAVDIEVRSIRNINNDPWIKAKDVRPGRWVYVTFPLGVECYQVQILGFGEAETLWAAAHKPVTWNDTRQGTWDPATSDRQFPLSALSRCVCWYTGHPDYRGHACFRAVDDLPDNAR